MDHSVFVAEIDDQHKEIFQAIDGLQEALSLPAPPPEIRRRTESLMASLRGHFAHEESLMHAARYGSFEWHKQQHRNALRRVRQFVRKIEEGDSRAPFDLVEHLSSWLHDHTRLTDRMLGAFLRGHERSMATVTFRAGTRPLNACNWKMSNGEPLIPQKG
jgi:hemerythrin